MSRQIHAVYLKCLFSLVLLLAIALPALGQSSSTASVTGIVQDTSDARISHASVKLINTQTGTESNSQTNKDGDFVLPNVMPGHYTLQIERDGFDTTQLTGITLNVGDNKSVIVRMKVGSKNETVTVDGSGLTINTTDGSVSTVIDQKFVANLPLNGRSFQDLISLTPGVTTQSPQTGYQVGSVGDFSVNGQRTESNNYMLDGVSANTSAGTGQGDIGAGGTGSLSSSTVLGTTQSLLSVDALQEFRVESSTYSAEYGRSPGGQIIMASRAGTDRFHGTIFDYLRNSIFDANDWFTDFYKTPQPPLRQNDFGGTLGGPVLLPGLSRNQNRTFFFFSYEGLRLSQSEPASLQYVPDMFMRQQAAPVMQPILNAFPQPTTGGIDYGTSASPNLAEFIQAYSAPSNIDSTSLRLDHTFGSRWHLFGRAAYTPSSGDTRLLSVVNTTAFGTQTYTVGVDGQLSNQMSNQLRAGFTKATAKTTQSLDNFGGSTPLNLAQALTGGQLSSGGPSFLLEYAVGTTQVGEEQSDNSLNQWNLTDSLSWSVARHVVKLGIDYRRLNTYSNIASPQVEFAYTDPMSTLANSSDFLDVYVSLPTRVIYNQTSLFAQDEWRVTTRLNISAGVRWDINPAPHSGNQYAPYPLLGNPNSPSTLMLGAAGGQLYRTTWDNFAPRFGVAWRAHTSPGMETVLRGGIGLFYDTGNSTSNRAFISPATSTSAEYDGASLPSIPSQLNIAPSLTTPYPTFDALPQDFKLPFTTEWNAALQQSLGAKQSISITYLGANGRRLVGEVEKSLHSVNPSFGTLILYQNMLTSNYQALQTVFQRQIDRGIQAYVGYTWSHALDYASSNLTYNYQRGNADFDVRSNFQGAVSWELPAPSHNRLAEAVVGHWGADGRIMLRTGFPVNPTARGYYDPTTLQYQAQRLNVNPNVPLYLYSGSYPGGRSINPSAFQKPPANTQGDAPRNFVRGFGEQQVNLAIRRIFPLTERLNLQFRAEAFNILNHPMFGTINSSFGTPTFGQATASLATSLPTVSPLYQQGGARSMQFALKLQF